MIENEDAHRTTPVSRRELKMSKVKLELMQQSQLIFFGLTGVLGLSTSGTSSLPVSKSAKSPGRADFQEDPCGPLFDGDHVGGLGGYHPLGQVSHHVGPWGRGLEK